MTGSEPTLVSVDLVYLLTDAVLKQWVQLWTVMDCVVSRPGYRKEYCTCFLSAPGRTVDNAEGTNAERPGCGKESRTRFQSVPGRMVENAEDTNTET